MNSNTERGKAKAHWGPELWGSSFRRGLWGKKTLESKQGKGDIKLFFVKVF